MDRTMDVLQICKSLHRSAFSHFQRLQFEGGEHDTLHQTMAQSSIGVYCELSRLLLKQKITRKQRRRQRQLRFKRKLEIEMLNQVAMKLNYIASATAEKESNVGKSSSCLRKRMSHFKRKVNKDFETEYLGDSSLVSSIVINSLQVFV
jgi:hypothetical protein